MPFSVPVIQKMMYGGISLRSVTTQVGSRSKPLVMMDSVLAAGDGLCLNGRRSRGPRRRDGYGVLVGGGGNVVVGVISL